MTDAPLLASISSASRRKLDEFGPQGLANTAWAFAKLVWLDVPFLQSTSA
jgi:hypothetical protein